MKFFSVLVIPSSCASAHLKTSRHVPWVARFSRRTNFFLSSFLVITAATTTHLHHLTHAHSCRKLIHNGVLYVSPFN
ncbi:hypothetical protein FN846DRAFT_957971 [Sphaerosporella brunnea]|uniref:Uncharacterized protein n=1 Tax=Sphaerosporella brunnea TaxID=1250544 RepID=A0A5J5ERG5_9PEZI|nr:hypothetical protein FN846DRAFT_957971 [Sphaerosporella brunnea]